MRGLPIHVLPINDSKEHEESEICSCKPEIKTHSKDGTEFGSWMIIHNAFDGREWNELGDKRNYK